MWTMKRGLRGLQARFDLADEHFTISLTYLEAIYFVAELAKLIDQEKPEFFQKNNVDPSTKPDRRVRFTFDAEFPDLVVLQVWREQLNGTIGLDSTYRMNKEDAADMLFAFGAPKEMFVMEQLSGSE